MQFLTALWLPIVASGLAVFVVSAVAWTALPTHKKEFAALSNETAVADALRAGAVTPGRYVIPHSTDQKGMASPEGKARLEQGPIAYITIAPKGVPAMGPMMAKSALSGMVISIFTAYLAWHTLRPGAEYLEVFRVTGTITFMTYALGSMSDSIWFAKPWKSFYLQAFDALLYAGVAAGMFGWLWPS